MKITFGCNAQKFPYWHNTDKDTVDITKPLPFKDGSVEMIYHSHVLEHISLYNAKCFLLKLCGFATMNKSKHDDPESEVILAGAYDTHSNHTLHYEVTK